MKSKDLLHLLEKMTLPEKIGQLQQLSGDFYSTNSSQITGPLIENDLPEETIYQAGSILGVSGKEEVRRIQEKFLSRNRLGIPLLFMADIIHGYREIFPIPLAQAATWDPELVKKGAQFAAEESYSEGIHVTFSPMADLVRDPRWGRVMESFGEDPYLSAQMAKACVEGYQGDTNDLTAPGTIAATIKHFAGYGAAEAGRDYNTVDMSRWQFFENYLPAYQAAITAGAKLAMTAFNLFEGQPISANKYILRDILRDRLGFKGTVISDWGAVDEIINHGIAEGGKQAAQLAMTAGVDIEMMTFDYAKHLVALIEEGIIDVRLIDESVLRILNLKNDLGLFENPFRGLNHQINEADYAAGKELALKTAMESLVLVKNKNAALPLTSDVPIIISGPFANTQQLLGGWSWQGNSDQTESIQGALSRHQLPHEVISDAEAIRQNQFAGKSAETILLVLGEPSEETGEATSKTDLRLTSEQHRILIEAARSGKKVISVLLCGRPLIDEVLFACSDAILVGWFGGSETAEAIVQTLYGDNNPSGKLPMTFPASVGQIPLYYNHYPTGRPVKVDNWQDKYLSKYIDSSNEPACVFGYGMSYANFSYTDLHQNRNELSAREDLEITIKLSNVSDMDGTEVVQLYVHDVVGETTRPVMQLVGFQRVFLSGYESRDVHFTITEAMLRYTHSDLTFKSDPGEFEYMIGTNSQQFQIGKFNLG